MDNLENTNPNRHTCTRCKRKFIISTPNRDGDKIVCTLCLTNHPATREEE